MVEAAASTTGSTTRRYGVRSDHPSPTGTRPHRPTRRASPRVAAPSCLSRAGLGPTVHVAARGVARSARARHRLVDQWHLRQRRGGCARGDQGAPHRRRDDNPGEPCPLPPAPCPLPTAHCPLPQLPTAPFSQVSPPGGAWVDGDSVSLHFAPTLWTVPLNDYHPEHNATLAFMFGPLVLAG